MDFDDELNKMIAKPKKEPVNNLPVASGVRYMDIIAGWGMNLKDEDEDSRNVLDKLHRNADSIDETINLLVRSIAESASESDTYRYKDSIMYSPSCPRMPMSRLYAYMLLAGYTLDTISKLSGLSVIHIQLLYATDYLIKAIAKAVKAAQADQLEDVIWTYAIQNPANITSGIFALKSRKAEYRDNYAPPASGSTNILIQIEGQRYEVKTATNAEQTEEG